MSDDNDPKNSVYQLRASFLKDHQWRQNGVFFVRSAEVDLACDVLRAHLQKLGYKEVRVWSAEHRGELIE